MAKDITSLNWENMRKFGFERLIFDKDNTLTEPGKLAFSNDAIRESFKAATDIFGKENTIVLSKHQRE